MLNNYNRFYSQPWICYEIMLKVIKIFSLIYGFQTMPSTQNILFLIGLSRKVHQSHFDNWIFYGHINNEFKLLSSNLLGNFKYIV